VTNSGGTGTTAAVLYLRVSTKEQAEMGGEVEGYSIPAQREAGLRKAQQLNASVVAEFVDRGESAKSADRPELQRLLAFVEESPTTYVIVHKVDRLARNRADDVHINLALRKAGVTLVSCTENIDETPSGMLLHGIMSSIAEFYSQNLANEVIKGSVQKAKAGGTVGKAPTGYRNIRQWVNGREIRTVEVDPERGPLMRWAFDRYATGEWTLRELHDAVTAKGLTSTGGPRTSSKPLSLSNFNRLLKTRYYTGVVTYRGVTYPGAHPPLISQQTFDRVQAVLAAHGVSGEKQRIHHHYLKGSVFCGRCGSRLSIMNAKNRWGTVYPYFYCLGRAGKRTGCTQRAILIDGVEEAVIEEWARRDLSKAERQDLEAFVLEELQIRRREGDAERKRQEHRIQQLHDERQKLLQAHYAGAIPLELLKSEQARITRETEQAERLLAASQLRFGEVAHALQQALDLVENCQATYVSVDARTRRRMNQALFERLVVDEDYVVVAQPSSEYELLLHPEVRAAARQRAAERERTDPRTYLRVGRPGRTGVRNELTPVRIDRGSSIDWLVGEGGLEPPRPCGHRNLNPARLPIPPLARVSQRRLARPLPCPNRVGQGRYAGCLHGLARDRARLGAYGRGRVLARLPLQPAPDRAGAAAGAGDGRPPLGRRQGPHHRPERLHLLAVAPGPCHLHRDPRRPRARAVRRRSRVRP
jgi:site-specific DNA recombinase